MKVLSKIVEILFPAACPSCDAVLLEGSGLCSECWNKIKFSSPPWCNKCGDSKGVGSFSNISCEGCIHYRKSYDKLRTGVVFDDIVRALLHKFKYNDCIMLSRLLASLAYRSASDFGDIDIIIPVPIHKSKLKKRKYNQAALLSKEIGHMLGKPYCIDLLKRVKDTVSQVGLSKKMRTKNVRKAFCVNVKRKNLILGKKILLVDDVISTGSTVDECSRCLKENGADSVYVLCIARNEVYRDKENIK